MFSEKSPQRAASVEVERVVEKEVECPRSMSYELVEQWGDGIPAFAEADPRSPEWRETPVVSLDLSEYGYGEVFVKDESVRSSNPTGTIKDRAAWELATIYRDYARALYLKVRAGTLEKQELEQLRIPRLSLLTAGNEGRAVAECFSRYDLPPPKLIVGLDTRREVMAELRKLRADVYAVDLSQELTPEAIKRLSGNEGGVDVTSVRAIEPSAVFYDWHVHEAFNESPDEVYVPYGSGRLMENYLVWQVRTMRNASESRPDPRLKVNASRVISMNIFGAEPSQYPSVADKLAAPFKPFLLFKDDDVSAVVQLAFTGQMTGKYQVNDERIRAAHEIMTAQGLEAEPSAAAGLALYIDRYESGLVDKKKKALVVSTGRGLV